jgi:glycosyltransferase involved in cell wall biosynthesis
MHPCISVITPSYNQGRFIEGTIQSVLLQNVSGVEYFISDGGSKDKTVQILKKYDDRLRWISGKDNGQADAVNKGIKATSGEIIGWLNSDDIYYPEALSTVKSFFDSHPSVNVIYGDANHIDENDDVIETYYTEDWNYERLKEICYICQPSVFFRRKVIEKVGLLDDRLQYCMDYDYWLRLGKHTNFIRIEKTLAGSRMYENNKTLGSKVSVHNEINHMFSEKFGSIPDKWIFAFARVSAEQRGYNRNLPIENGKFVILMALMTISSFIRWRQSISISTIKYIIRHFARPDKKTLSYPK